MVTNKDGKSGLIDNEGNVILDTAFDRISYCSGGSVLVYSKTGGWHLLSKVMGKFATKEETPPTSSEFYSKVTITRGPQNSFVYEEDEIIVLPPVLSTVSRTTHSEYTKPKPQ